MSRVIPRAMNSRPMYSWVKPRISVPVHGELRHLTEHARFARELQVPRAIVATNGQMLRLAPGEPEIVDETPSGRLISTGVFSCMRKTGTHAGGVLCHLPVSSRSRLYWIASADWQRTLFSIWREYRPLLRKLCGLRCPTQSVKKSVTNSKNMCGLRPGARPAKFGAKNRWFASNWWKSDGNSR